MSKERSRPFLRLPFKKQKYNISEGWNYSEEEKLIHGFVGHGAIDFELPRGTPVLAAAKGWAVSSYFGYFLKREGKTVLYQGQPLGFGLGYFVQIYHPSVKLFTSYGHLEKVAESIKFHAPKTRGNNLWPVGCKVDPERLAKYRWATKVEQGEGIGYVGDSGLTWGYKDYPVRPDPRTFPSWDEVHLHFEVFRRVGSRKRKIFFDPYGIKSTRKDYRVAKMGSKDKVLWLRDKNGTLLFAG